MRLRGAVAGLVVMAFAMSAHAQSLPGTWRNGTYGITMTLDGNGTYTFEGPQGTSSGRWAQQGYMFTMADPTGRVVPYRVVALTATGLMLVDAYGVQLAYERVVPAPVAAPRAPAKTPARVLAEAGGKRLTTSDLDGALGIVEFVIGGLLPASDRERFTSAAQAEFGADPAAFLAEMGRLGSSLADLHRLTDPAQVAAARQQLFTAFWKAAAPVPVAERPLLLRLIFDHVEILAVDEGAGLVLTRRDLQAALAYLLFAHGLYCEVTGQRLPVSPAMQQTVTAGLTANFKNLPVEQKQFLAGASVVWASVQAQWSRLDAFQQGQYKVKLAARFPDGSSHQQPASAPSAGRAESLADRQADFAARQRTFQIMHDINLQSHATSLNIIENIGGTGNYWEVVPSSY